MLDSIAYPVVRPHMASVMDKLAQGGMSSGKVAIAAFVISLTGCFCVGMGMYVPALIFLLLGRAGAGLTMSDNAAAISAKRRYLLTLADFTVFGAFAFLFSLGAPETSMAAAFVIFSILLMGIAYVGAGNPKGGLIGHTEMILFMALCCLYPPAFPAACIFFGLICWITAALRAISAARTPG